MAQLQKFLAIIQNLDSRLSHFMRKAENSTNCSWVSEL